MHENDQPRLLYRIDAVVGWGFVAMSNVVKVNFDPKTRQKAGGEIRCVEVDSEENPLLVLNSTLEMAFKEMPMNCSV